MFSWFFAKYNGYPILAKNSSEEKRERSRDYALSKSPVRDPFEPFCSMVGLPTVKGEEPFSFESSEISAGSQ
jgi:hypothetical protein